jgi:hypothetical protein
MWKERLAARFHTRSASLQAQGAPLIPAGGSRPLSTMTLDPVQEVDDQPARSDVPAALPSLVTQPPTTATDEKAKATPEPPAAPKRDLALAQATRDIESTDLLGMRSIRAFLAEEIDTAQAAAPLSAYCFMTGFMYVFFRPISPVAHPTQRRSVLFCDIRLVRLPDGQLCTGTSVVAPSRTR